MKVLEENRTALNDWLGLSAMLIGVFILALDVMITDVCVPAIVRDLSISSGNASYIVTVYLVITASIIILCGKAGDIIGARKTFIVSIIGFGFSSLITALAGNLLVLLLGRFLQAISFAFAVPASMSLLNHLFPSGQIRVFVFSLWTMVIGSAAAIGPVLGGVFVQWFSWRWAFLVNLPLVLLCVVGVYYNVMPIEKKCVEKSIDVWGALTLVLGASLSIFGFQASANLGWIFYEGRVPLLGVGLPFSISPTPLLIALGFICFYYFFKIEKKREQQGCSVILEMSLLRIPSFTWGTVVASLMTGSLFGLMFILPLYSAYVLDEPALISGMMLLPLGIGMAIGGPLTSFFSIEVLKTYLPKLMLVQLIIFILIFFYISMQWHYIVLSMLLLLLGLAWGGSYSVLVNILLADVPTVLSGVAGGAQIMGRLLCGALATALMTSVLITGIHYEYAYDVKDKRIQAQQITTEQMKELKRLDSLKQKLRKQSILLKNSKQENLQIKQFNQYLIQIKKDIINSMRLSVLIAILFAVFALFCSIILKHYHKKIAKVVL